MAPKRKPPPQPAGPQKKGRPEAGEEDSFRSTAEALRAAPTEKRVIRVDPTCPLRHNPGTQVHEDYDCTLNQTNIGSNNNKFYIMQLLQEDAGFACWNRWGRVGETDQSKISHFESLADAKKDFEKKFREKTKNHWADRDRFVAHPGKYTLIEVQGEDEAQEAVVKVTAGEGRGRGLAGLCPRPGRSVRGRALLRVRPCPAAPAHHVPLPRWMEAQRGPGLSRCSPAPWTPPRSSSSPTSSARTCSRTAWPS